MSKKTKKPLSNIDGSTFYLSFQPPNFTPVFEGYARNLEGDDRRTDFQIIESLTPDEAILFHRLLARVIARLEKIQWGEKTFDGRDTLDDLRGPTAIWGSEQPSQA